MVEVERGPSIPILPVQFRMVNEGSHDFPVSQFLFGRNQGTIHDNEIERHVARIEDCRVSELSIMSDVGVNETIKFNAGVKLVLLDCTSDRIKTHDWTEKSPIVRAFRSPTDYGINKQSSVIVIMGSGDLSTL